MIASKILLKNPDASFENFKEFDALALLLAGPERDSFVNDLKFSIQQGWIKNLQNETWDPELKAAVYEYYSSDVHQARYFQNYVSSRSYFIQGLEKIKEHGWTLEVQTAAEKTIIPFADANRIFDEDIEVLS